MRAWIRTGIAVAWLGIGSTSLAAQHQSPDCCPGPGAGKMQGMDGAMHEMMPNMMRLHAYDPATLLERREALSLSSTQVRQLEALAQTITAARASAHASHAAAHEKVGAEFDKDTPDTGKVRELARAAMGAMADVHATELAGFAQAKGILTPDQRGLAEAAQHERHGGGGRPQH